VNELVETREQPEPAETLPRAVQHCSAGQSGKYFCLRCGWRWSPRRGSPDPPNACARCRTAHWNTPPESARANHPEDPKWHAERDTLANRRRARHLARLKELAQELGANASAVAVKPTLLRQTLKNSPSGATNSRRSFSLTWLTLSRTTEGCLRKSRIVG
jgi:hypothetical protein